MRRNRFRPGEVVVANVPAFDPTLVPRHKRRPVVIVCSELFMQHDDDLIVCPLTTRSPRALDLELDWSAAGLPRLCRIRPKPYVISRHSVTARRGQLQPADRTALQQRLRDVLGLS